MVLKKCFFITYLNHLYRVLIFPFFQKISTLISDQLETTLAHDLNKRTIHPRNRGPKVLLEIQTFFDCKSDPVWEEEVIYRITVEFYNKNLWYWIFIRLIELILKVTRAEKQNGYTKGEPLGRNYRSSSDNFIVNNNNFKFSQILERPSTGLVWYVNSKLSPELYVERGKTYTFVVEGGKWTIWH